MAVHRGPGETAARTRGPHTARRPPRRRSAQRLPGARVAGCAAGQWLRGLTAAGAGGRGRHTNVSGWVDSKEDGTRRDEGAGGGGEWWKFGLDL